MKLRNDYRIKEKHTVSHVTVSRRATCHVGVSTGQPYADVIMAVDDVSVDLVNIAQVNGSTGSSARSVGSTCQSPLSH